MTHEITIREDGFAEAAFSLQPAWHGLGQVFDHVMVGSEAITAAGLDVLVEQEPVYRRDSGPETALPLRSRYDKLEGFLLNVRSDNRQVLGLVTEQYKVVQNVEAFRFLDDLVDRDEIRYESAFSLSGGKRVVLLARMPGADKIIKGDHILPYILLSLSHDGTESVRFGPTAVRVVCANTYRLAVGEGRTRELCIRHTGNIHEKLQQARKILGVASEHFADYTKLSRKLAKKWLSVDEWQEFLDIMCPLPDKHDPDYTAARDRRLRKTRFQIWERFEGEHQSLPGMERTAWAAYNAVAEYVDHLPRRGSSDRAKAEARFNVALYGPGRDQKERAFRTACRFAGVTAA